MEFKASWAELNEHLKEARNTYTKGEEQLALDHLSAAVDHIREISQAINK